MVNIEYSKENENFFEILFDLRSYIPGSLFIKFPQHTELHFIHGLLIHDSRVLYVGQFPMIWSTHFRYKYGDKEFLLILDEDYDLISFSVDDPKDRIEIAEFILKLIDDGRKQSAVE